MLPAPFHIIFFLYHDFVFDHVNSSSLARAITAICSPRITSCGIRREHSANFRFSDLTLITGIWMFRDAKRDRHSLVWSTCESSLDAVEHRCNFRRFHTSNTSVMAMFQCLSQASINPVTQPVIVLSFRMWIWKGNKFLN